MCAVKRRKKKRRKKSADLRSAPDLEGQQVA